MQGFEEAGELGELEDGLRGVLGWMHDDSAVDLNEFLQIPRYLFSRF